MSKKIVESVLIMNADEMRRTLERLAYEVMERHGNCKNLLLLGIQRRGVNLAERLARFLEQRTLCKEMPLGVLDITLYRDDWTTLSQQPAINPTNIPYNLEEYTVLLVDDVLYTGRTIRAALEALVDFGRPRKVELLVLVDRGHRELPIHADYVGKMLPTAREERVDVLVLERDGQDAVLLSQPK